MTITPYRTKKIVVGDSLYKILDASLPRLRERTLVVISSKIIAICQGNAVKNDGSIDKKKLIQDEAKLYIDEPSISRYNVILTVKRDMLTANAGIDESNGNGYFILWPKDVDNAIVDIWNYLRAKHSIRFLGVIFSESRTTPLRWGTLGVGLAWCGFEALKNYIGTPDVFRRNLKMTKLNILDGLAAAAGVVMGEGSEQTPLALVSDVPFVRFQSRPPTQKEINSLKIRLEDDMYSPLTDSPKWEKGGSKA